MCKAISSKEFRRKIEAAEEGRPAGIIMEYLDATGYILSNRNGSVGVADDLDEKIKFINGEVQMGDVVWAQGHGLFLIIDKHPKANNDGHHFRGIKVTPTLTGSFEMIVDQRSSVLTDISCLRVRHTSFDIQRVSELCFERYEAYSKIVEINEALKQMKEINHA